MMRLLSYLLVSFLLIQPLAYAKEKSKGPSISPGLYKKLTKTEALISKKDYQKAEQKLKSMLAGVDKKSYEEAVVLRSLSSVYAIKGQYNLAAKMLSKVIGLKVLPSEQEQQAFLNLGQLYMAIEQYHKAIKILEPWLQNNPKGNTQINVLLANAYSQLKKYRKALPYIKKAIATAKKPEEPWYQLNLAIYYELEDYSSAIVVLKKLVRLFPDKKNYWTQLSSTYQQIKHYRKAASVQHLAYKKGFVTKEREILALAHLYLHINSPYKAAKLLKLEIQQHRVKHNSKNWELLANAWTMAKEFKYAIIALETASKLNDKGSLYQQLGQIYVEQEEWAQAISALNKALSKGGLRDTGTTYILLGMSHYELKSLRQAKKAFRNASRFSKNKKIANQWLAYISEPEKT